MKVVYTLLGGISGTTVEGYADSGGLLQLDDELRQLPETFVQKAVGWDQWSAVALAMRTGNSVYRNILIGFSGGGAFGTWLCNAISQPVELFVAVDPSPTWQMHPIGPNVKKCLCFHNTTPAMLGLGGGRVTGRANIETVEVHEQHLLLDWNPAVHGKIVEEVRAL